ncbi:MAG: Sua5/YciO/YrdC/YwlC family protein [Cardiobacteriaceae bacterium]|nr:Sua5/YciO/YrdC/YwlC family protein [Cardiobacteriaceae bacterium]
MSALQSPALPIFSLKHFDAIIRHLEQGGLLAYPTESVFGLGCLPFHQSALAQIYALKGREMTKTCLLVAAEISQIESWITCPYPSLPSTPTTFLLPASDSAPKHLVNVGKIAIRIASYPPLKALCRYSPLVSTSANPSGFPAAKTVAEVGQYFAGRYEGLGVVDGEVEGLANPSQIIDACTGERIR